MGGLCEKSLMNRRNIILAAVVAVTAPTATPAQTPATPELNATPLATPERENFDAIYNSTGIGQAIVVLNGFEEASFREFELADPGFEVLMGGLTAVAVYGIAFTDSTAATLGKESLELRLSAYFIESATDLKDLEIESSDVREIGIGDLGGRSSGVSVEVTSNDEMFNTVSYCGIVVQKSRYVQLSMGAGILGVVAPLIDIAASLANRWPSDRLADMLPDLGDVPAGMTVVEELVP